MRALILVAGAALGLAACGRNGQDGQTLNANDTLTAEDIVANDVTAIDAVTGDAANMAADTDINFTNEQVPAGNGSADRKPSRPAEPAARPSTAPATSNAAEPDSAPAANAAANAAE
jgi:hypothetical protein